MAGRPTAEQIAAERAKIYVRQLEVVELDDESTLEAINNYLRATITRTKLSEEGIVHEDSFGEFQDALTGFWRNKTSPEPPYPSDAHRHPKRAVTLQ